MTIGKWKICAMVHLERKFKLMRNILYDGELSYGFAFLYFSVQISRPATDVDYENHRNIII